MADDGPDAAPVLVYNDANVMATGVVCRCGNSGCLEAVAGGGAVARQLLPRAH